MPPLKEGRVCFFCTYAMCARVATASKTVRH